MRETINDSTSGQIKLAVFADVDSDIGAAKALAQHLNADLTRDKAQAELADLVLRFDADGLALEGDGLVLRGDFTRMARRLKRENLQGELLVRAAKFKKETRQLFAIDATAGLGDDALLLAASGYNVLLYEYDPVIAALLRDAMRRAYGIPDLAEIVSRMELREQDSIVQLPLAEKAPDLILLDPMFPSKTKSALTKKKFQLIHLLKCPCADEHALFNAALAAHPRRIVIKRPINGPWLADVKPSYSFTGKAIRYDCLNFPQNGVEDNTK